MIQLFQYPHETLLQTSTPWTQDDSIQGYDDIERKQRKAKQDSQNSTEWNPSASSMNSITLTVLHLIKGLVNYDGIWQRKNQNKKAN